MRRSLPAFSRASDVLEKRLAAWAVEAGGFFEPLGALGGFDCEKLGGGEPDGFAVAVIRADPHRRFVGAEYVKAHQRLVDAADLLDLQGPVREALALELDERMEKLIDAFVVDRRDA